MARGAAVGAITAIEQYHPIILDHSSANTHRKCHIGSFKCVCGIFLAGQGKFGHPHLDQPKCGTPPTRKIDGAFGFLRIRALGRGFSIRRLMGSWHWAVRRVPVRVAGPWQARSGPAWCDCIPGGPRQAPWCVVLTPIALAVHSVANTTHRIGQGVRDRITK